LRFDGGGSGVADCWKLRDVRNGARPRLAIIVRKIVVGA